MKKRMTLRDDSKILRRYLNKSSHMSSSTCKNKVIYAGARQEQSPRMALSNVFSVTYANDMVASQLPTIVKGGNEFAFPSPKVFE